MARVSHRLSNSFEGALAGGGGPASSPLYVFGPFLRLSVVAGVAPVTFGASVWLVVLTVAVVSAMYRLVMTWVTDGSGGSGLTEEEFGGWAMKVNAAITVVEYTLTFLVSIAALDVHCGPIFSAGYDVVRCPLSNFGGDCDEFPGRMAGQPWTKSSRSIFRSSHAWRALPALGNGDRERLQTRAATACVPMPPPFTPVSSTTH